MSASGPSGPLVLRSPVLGNKCAVLLRFEAKKSVDLISKLGCPNLNASKISKQYSKVSTITSGVYADIVSLYKLNIFSVPNFFDKNILHFEKLYFNVLAGLP